MRRHLVLATGLLAIVAGQGTAEDKPLPRVPPTEPAKAVATLRLQNGFRAELIAAEPLIADPVAITYDENGRAYVVEMIDYPYADPTHDRPWEEQTSPPLGQIRRLEDVDGDGRFDKSTVFADSLSWPSGIAVWKGGVYVAATPDVWYFKDTDGDGRADIRRKVFTGFRKFNVQAVMNNLQWGLDHHLYGAGSSNSGSIRSGNADDPMKGTPLGRNDFRFDPRTEDLEIVSGGARFGQAVDDWGERFLCNIRNPVQHVVLPAEALRRNPFAQVSTSLQDVVDSGDAVAVFQISPPEPWRVLNSQRLAADTSTKSPFDSTVASGYVTSSSGVTIYRGAAYPAEYRGNAFTGEVAGNLVMRYILSPDGVTYRGTRAHERVEFLASTDNWFRPVNFANAPDGTLHVLDMYRETIEHPWSIPDDLKARVDLTSGRDRGRIYRLLPPEFPADFTPPPAPRLGSATTAELVAALENPNGWWRDTAHRLLFERQDAAAIEPLRQLLEASSSPVTRVHALWSLNGLEALTNDNLTGALQDADSHVREAAVQLAAERLPEHPDLLSSLLPLASDTSIRVRFHTALAFGNVRDSRTTAALATIARRDAADRWMQAAIVSSLSGDDGTRFLTELLSDGEFLQTPPAAPLCASMARTIAASGDDAGVRAVLESLAAHDTVETNQLRRDVLVGLGQGLQRRRKSLAQLATGDDFAGRPLVERERENASQVAGNGELPPEVRIRAIELLGCFDDATAGDTLRSLLTASHPSEVQSAAVAAMAKFAEPSLAGILLERYRSLTPSVQQSVVDVLLTRQEWVPPLFDAMEQGLVPINRIAPARRTVYMQSANAAIRDRARKVFASDQPGPRKGAIDSYRPSLSLAGDVARGETVFRRECSQCHRLGGAGFDVGPNLATIRNRSPEELLTQILDPNREVSPNFLQYVVVTQTGELQTGVIVAETPHAVTLRAAEGKEQVLLRSEIEELRSAGQSLMPEGLEQKITPQEMADLIAYLLANRN